MFRGGMTEDQVDAYIINSEYADFDEGNNDKMVYGQICHNRLDNLPGSSPQKVEFFLTLREEILATWKLHNEGRDVDGIKETLTNLAYSHDSEFYTYFGKNANYYNDFWLEEFYNFRDPVVNAARVCGRIIKYTRIDMFGQ